MIEYVRAARPDPRTGVRPFCPSDGSPAFHYLPSEFNAPERVPEGMILVHNHVRHGDVSTQRTNGFRFWFQDPGPRRERCGCGWAPGAPEHYRVGCGCGWAPGAPRCHCVEATG